MLKYVTPLVQSPNLKAKMCIVKTISKMSFYTGDTHHIVHEHWGDVQSNRESLLFTKLLFVYIIVASNFGVHLTLRRGTLLVLQLLTLRLF